MHTPNRRTTTGSKGMSEGGVMGAIGAVMSAVNDALSPFGVVADRQPLAPDYVRRLIRSSNRIKDGGSPLDTTGATADDSKPAR
jgi:aerobic carbon-monoxide dehydrogenase large subunit